MSRPDGDEHIATFMGDMELCRVQAAGDAKTEASMWLAFLCTVSGQPVETDVREVRDV